MNRIAVARSMALVLLLAWATGCADTSAPAAAKPPVADSLPRLIVSGPVRGPGGVLSVTASAARASGSGSVVYVSLPPGSVPAGLEVTIRDLATGSLVTATIVDGGFDPVAIAASIGDTLVVEIARSGSGPIRGWEVVIARRPVVVRTDPPPHKRDVPLNSFMVVVFSEPIDSATITARSVQLLRDGVLVAGHLSVADDRLRVAFQPDSLLVPESDYTLSVTTDVADWTGDRLERAVAVAFTTGDAIAAVPARFAAVSAGAASHTCGLITTGAAYCWGENTYGELGTGTTAHSTTPAAVVGGLAFSAVSAGWTHSCGVTTGAAVYCWGSNFYGQLGNDTAWGPSPVAAAPVAVVGGIAFATVSAGGEHTCGVTAGGTAYCWGYDYDGELGNGPPPWSSCTPGQAVECSTPVAVSGGLTFAMLSAGIYHTCGVTTGGAAYCWGDNTYGELGTGTTTGPEECGPEFDGQAPWACSRAPVPVSGGITFTMVSAGAEHTCGVSTDGTAYCWGANANGVLGDGTTTNSATPVAVAGGLAFAAVSASMVHTCGVTTGGAGYCWGLGGTLGTGTIAGSSTPVAVAGGLAFKAVSAGGGHNGPGGHTCGVTTGGAAYCWGANNTGQLGDSTRTDRNAPVKVAGQP